MVIIFIGIEGYLQPNDVYDAVLPAVSDWGLDRRQKAAKKNNFMGGFTVSYNKNDDSRFFSLNWEALPENDIEENTIGTDTYELVSHLTNTAIINNIAPTTTFIIPLRFDLAANTPIWIRRNNNSFIAAMVMSNYTAGQNRISLKLNNGSGTFNKGETLVIHKNKGLGMLSIAAMSASGETHTIRDFLGRLVKVIFQSPRYQSVAGTDHIDQVYYNVSVEMDIVADTMSKTMQLTKQLQVNVSNDRLPYVSTIAAPSGTFSLASFFVTHPYGYNFLPMELIDNNYLFNLVTIENIAPYIPAATPQNPLYLLATKMTFFKDFISAGQQMNIRFIANGTIVREDTTNPEIEISTNMSDMLFLGQWNATYEYAYSKVLIDYDEDNGLYPAGTWVKKDGTDYYYLSLVNENNFDLADRTKWYWFSKTVPIIVYYNNQLYKLVDPNTISKNQTPGADGVTAWELYNISGTTIQFKILTEDLNESNSLIFIMSPYSVMNTRKIPNTSSVMLRLPVVKSSPVTTINFNTKAGITKISELLPSGDSQLSGSYMGDNQILAATSGLELVENVNLASKVLAFPYTNDSNKTWSFVGEMYSRSFNTTQTTKPLVNYTTLDFKGVVNNDVVISDGVFRLELNSTSGLTFFSAKYQVEGVNKIATGIGTTMTSVTEAVITSFNTLMFNKILIETVYNPENKEVKFSLYKIRPSSKTGTETVTLTDLSGDAPVTYTATVTYTNGIKLVTDTRTNQYVSSECGVIVERVKMTQQFTATESNLAADTILQEYSKSLADTGTVVFAGSSTYTMNPIDDIFKLKYFHLEGEKW